MKWLQYIAVAVGNLKQALPGGIAWNYRFVTERMASKEHVEGSRSGSLRLGLREVAKCVDTPEYVGKSDRAQREPSCETRLLRVLDDTRAR